MSVSLPQHAYTMPPALPLYTPPPFEFRDSHILTFQFRTTPAAHRRLAPEPLAAAAEPVLALYVSRLCVSAPMEFCYREAALLVPVSYRGEPGLFVSQMYLDEALPIVIGREIWGFPKAPAIIDLREDPERVMGKVDVWTEPIVRARLRNPTPVDPAAIAQPATWYSLKIIPGSAPGAKPDVAKLIATPVDMRVKSARAGHGELELLSARRDILGDIPVVSVESAVLTVADFTLGAGEVVLDYLAEERASAPA